MEPSKTNATSAHKVPDLNQRDAHRQTIPVAGDADGPHDSPPPYEPSATVSTSASANGASHDSSAAVLTPPASTFQPTPASPGRWEDDARSSTSSRGNEETGFLAGQRGRDEGGYRRTDPMVVGRENKWESMMDQPGCCCSSRGGCCFSDRGGCCFSDRGGCCFSDTEGCCFSSDGACCFSGGMKSQRG